LQILQHQAFANASIDTGFLDRESAALAASIPTELPPAVLAAIEQHRTRLGTLGTLNTLGTLGTDPFLTLKGWRG